MEADFIRILASSNVWYFILGFPAIMASLLLYFTRRDLKTWMDSFSQKLDLYIQKNDAHAEQIIKSNDKVSKALLILILSKNGTKKHAKDIAREMLKKDILSSEDLDDELAKDL